MLKIKGANNLMSAWP